MFDLGRFANGSVWIANDLRRWRNGNGKRNDDAHYRSHYGRRSAVGSINVVGNIDVDGNLGDVGRSDIFRDAGNVGIDGNVRPRFEQHCCIVEPNVNGTCHVERRCSSGSSVGIL